MNRLNKTKSGILKSWLQDELLEHAELNQCLFLRTKLFVQNVFIFQPIKICSHLMRCMIGSLSINFISKLTLT